MYLTPNGLRTFKNDTGKEVDLKIITIKVGGSALTPVIEALAHFHAVSHFGGDEGQKALCSIISQCRKWKRVKSLKLQRAGSAAAAAAAAAAGPEPNVLKRQRSIDTLMNEAIAALAATSAPNAAAIQQYETRKDRGGRGMAQPMSRGYANERVAYIAFNKKKSLSGTLIDELLEAPKSKTRTGLELGEKADAKLQKEFRSKTSFAALSVKDWEKIDKIAAEVEGQRLQVKYMTKFERLRWMLESDSNGGLQYVGGRSAACRAGTVHPYAMDEWGNLYTAPDEATKGSYAMFNHSSFTAGDIVVCAGMLEIDNTGRLIHISNDSGHYKPSADRLRALVQILNSSDYNVNLASTEIRTVVPNPDREVDFPITRLWNRGNWARFLAANPPDQQLGGPAGYAVGL